jgi:hypothetical protein
MDIGREEGRDSGRWGAELETGEERSRVSSAVVEAEAGAKVVVGSLVVGDCGAVDAVVEGLRR